jgi:hypothetical protein
MSRNPNILASNEAQVRGPAIRGTPAQALSAVILAAGGTSYVLSRTVFDRAERTIATAADNGAITTISLDGAGRQPLVVDALGNSVQRTFDGNGNATLTTRVEQCTISGTIAAESPTNGKAGPCFRTQPTWMFIGYADQGACAGAFYGPSDKVSLNPVLSYLGGLSVTMLRGSATSSAVVAGGMGTAGSVIAAPMSAVGAWNAGQWYKVWLQCGEPVAIAGRWVYTRCPSRWECK